ncbi:MAG: DNA mismatch repair protein MutS [Spirochaetes bacterium]|nr:DNA mismatch repair protein MutS [Spirochaetota bacterium]
MDFLDVKNLTPMMKQFYSIKERYKDYIIFFRAGDFYEMFDKDAEEASLILNIVLTQRAGIKMCGVPYHSYKPYLKKLIDNGKKVAICEQLEDPKKAKGIVKRGVVEIYTPGMIINDEFLTKENNFICNCLVTNEQFLIYYIALADISTGEIFLSIFRDDDELIDYLYKNKPKEIIFYLTFNKEDNIINNLKSNFKNKVFFSNISFEELNLNNFEKEEFFFEFNDFIKEVLETNNFESWKSIEKNKNLIYLLILMLNYFRNNHISDLSFINKVIFIEENNYLKVDEGTRRNLEIFSPLFSGEKDTTLINFIDFTSTPMGRRKLKEFMLFPLKNVNLINRRLNFIEELLQNYEITQKIKNEFKTIKDIERLFVKIYLKRCSPVDIVNFKNSIYKIYEISNIWLDKLSLFKNFLCISPKILECLELIDKALIDDPSFNIEEGSIFKIGYNYELDELIKFYNDSEKILFDYLEKLKVETNIQNLKIKYNKVFGYFIEVSKGNIEKVPNYFIRKQTLTNAERFTTEFLIETESKILNFSEKRIELEKKLFDDLCEKIKNIKIFLYDIFNKVAELDVFISLAIVAKKYNFVKPEFINENELIIEEGFHPIVKKFIEEESKDQFIPNDLKMDKDKFFHIITGPNMSGKSTFLRQNAIIIYLSHIGSYVPAKKVKLHVFDNIFSRVGASDNIARGQSTFLAEMSETAYIIKNATSKSFIILDEVGRGTSTFDGMSLAFAISEYIINKIKAKTLFATHYFELVHLDENPQVECYHTLVKEWEDKIIFLKKIEKGYADKSYGIYVAKIAGIPFDIIERANELLSIIKNNDIRFDFEIKKEKKENYLFDFFENEKESILNSILNFDIYNKSPLESLKFLEELKARIARIKSKK